MKSIFACVSEGNTAAVKELLRLGVNVDEFDRDGRTPLLNVVASPNYSLELLRLLLEHGANPNSPNASGFTALHFCAQNRYADAIRELIANGADVNVQDNWGNTPLLKALGASPECVSVIGLLLGSGANPMIKNKTGISVIDHVSRLKSHPNRELFSSWL